MNLIGTNVFVGGFLFPLIIIFFLFLMFDDVISVSFGIDIFYAAFSGIINPININSDSPNLFLNALIVSVYGIPLWMFYWFLFGPKKIIEGMVTLTALLKVLAAILSITLIYLIICFIDNPVELNPKSAVFHMLIVNPIFFYFFVLCPIYFLSLCYTVFFRLTLIYLRK